MRKTTALLDPIPAAVLALVVLAATAQPPAPQRTDASRFREPDPIAFDDHAGFVSIFDGQTLPAITLFQQRSTGLTLHARNRFS
jgi:hypothetical protein